MNSKSAIVRQYFDKFPNLPNQTMAKKLNHDLPEIFPTVKSTRTIVRKVTGSSGKQTRKEVRGINAKYYKPENIEKLFKLEDGEKYEFQHYKITGKKLLVLPDIHIPYHNKPVIIEALKFGKKKEVDTILLNGDVIDNYQLSKFAKDPTKRRPVEEIEMTREFLRELREMFPEAKIIFKEGNHEERWETYLKLAAPVLYDMAEFRLDVILRLGELHIEYIRNKSLIRFGKLNLLHGHEYRTFGMGGVNPARWLSMRTHENTACGHFHTISEHRVKDVQGKPKAWWSMGCLCQLVAEYAPYNNWVNSWGSAEILDDDGNFRFKNIEYEKDY